jgi:hypothetical protein
MQGTDSLMTKRLLTIFTGLLLLMFGCDCHRHAEGIVVDDATKRPIAGVQIVNNSDFEREQTQNLFVTDSAGQFSYSDISGGIFGCPDLVLVFTKSDYLVKRINVSSGIDTVFLSK